jgi:hypothetical protein
VEVGRPAFLHPSRLLAARLQFMVRRRLQDEMWQDEKTLPGQVRPSGSRIAVQGQDHRR